MNILIFGPQASGKGTQAARIAKHFGVPHISTGDIFRDNIKRGTELGKLAASLINDGTLIPDDVTNDLIKNRLEEEDCKDGFILDGYPRTRPQAEFLDTLPQKIDAAISLEVSDEEVQKRITGRRTCKICKKGYNVNIEVLMPKKEGVCDIDGGELFIRDDDKQEAIIKRLATYNKLTAPLLDFYREKGLLKAVNGDPAIDAVFEDTIKILSIK